MSLLGNVLILGDDYSAFAGRISEGLVPCYPTKRVPNTLYSEQMWWYKLLTETDARLIGNYSEVGATVCNTDHSGYDAPHSFIQRIDQLIADGYFKKQSINTVIIFGGTNDDSENVPLGTVQYGGWRREDLLCFAPAYCYLLDRLKANLPNKRIICLEDMKMRSTIRRPIEEACHHFRVDLIHLREISTANGYPDARGMEQISNQIQLYLLYA